MLHVVNLALPCSLYSYPLFICILSMEHILIGEEFIIIIIIIILK